MGAPINRLQTLRLVVKQSVSTSPKIDFPKSHGIQVRAYEFACVCACVSNLTPHLHSQLERVYRLHVALGMVDQH